MKKKWIILISTGLLVLAGVVWFNSGEPPIEIKGDLSAQDVAEIKHVVRHELRRRILLRFSWQNVENLPTAVKDYSRFRFRSIELFTNGLSDGPVTAFGSIAEGASIGAFVVVSWGGSAKYPLKSQHFMVARKMSGWAITNESFIGIFE